MENGKCHNCGSDQVYRSLNGIIAGEKYVYVRNLSRLTPRTDKMTYICTSCGHYEDYIPDKNILDKIKEKWEKVNP